MTSSYEEDTDGAEQLLADNQLSSSSLPSAAVLDEPIDEKCDEELITKSPVKASRFDSLLSDVGLTDQIETLSSLPAKRPLSSDDVFCNRELKLGGISAIGYDMDYTLAQYQQPAFDQLAFDGAKEKLVKSLGYPEEVLDFEYDHNVRVL